ncbi:hypothetical protein GJ744_012377 [Endocarpon pusillum]|uniref:Glycan binding protein Y3-like domain-containing protein n=1 Tax=Endocarpon pusillum TaxID=364733 RepID=A0A8H7AB69_9EURO|nr:hypothetical protein GJ744_012377 [Endocarpon pusillum]
MHLFKTILVGGTSLLSIASAGCFSGGTTWDDKGRAIATLEGVCKELTGDYNGGITRSTCRNGSGDLRYNFTVKKDTSGHGKLGRDYCVRMLSREISGCDHGGRSSYADFTFTSDPNAGKC